MSTLASGVGCAAKSALLGSTAATGGGGEQRRGGTRTWLCGWRTVNHFGLGHVRRLRPVADVRVPPLHVAAVLDLRVECHNCIHTEEDYIVVVWVGYRWPNLQPAIGPVRTPAARRPQVRHRKQQHRTARSRVSHLDRSTAALLDFWGSQEARLSRALKIFFSKLKRENRTGFKVGP